MKQEMMGWQLHQLDHMQIICTSRQTDNHASTSSLVFTGQMLFLTPNQQCQSTKGKKHWRRCLLKKYEDYPLCPFNYLKRAKDIERRWRTSNLYFKMINLLTTWYWLCHSTLQYITIIILHFHLRYSAEASFFVMRYFHFKDPLISCRA